jgi:hypothetical protein
VFPAFGIARNPLQYGVRRKCRALSSGDYSSYSLPYFSSRSPVSSKFRMDADCLDGRHIVFQQYGGPTGRIYAKSAQAAVKLTRGMNAIVPAQYT